jgi:hypothetical protein
MRGAARRPGAKAYFLYVERPDEGGNEAAGSLSARYRLAWSWRRVSSSLFCSEP